MQGLCHLPKPQLLVLVPGVEVPGGRHRITATAPELVAALAPAIERLRDCGLQIDRRGVMLRPDWRTDAAQRDLLAHRDRLDVVLTRIDEPDRGVERFGALWPDEACELWWFALGAPRRVTATFDLQAHLQRRLPAAARRRAQCRGDAGAWRIGCSDGETWREVTAALQQAPAPAFGRLDSRAGVVEFLAHAHVAFGPRTMSSRLPRADEQAIELQPPAGVTLPEVLDAGTFAAIWAARCAAKLCRKPMPAVDPATTGAPAFPDLLALLQTPATAATATAPRAD